jgi:RibD C-terminal domain
MINYEYLAKTVQADVRRAREGDRLRREARRARKAHRQPPGPAAPARRRTEMGKLGVSEILTLDEVSTLKKHVDGDIVIVGSFQLVRTLVQRDLVDELRLKIFPLTLGVGERLFGETGDEKPMRLVDTQALEGGIAYLTYQSVRDV